MSIELINKTINDLSISSLKILYDFNSYSGNFINSIEPAGLDYSGEIKSFNNNFVNNSSGSGFFDGQCIEIKNVSGITSESATILFSQTKTGVSNGVIFSHMDPNGPSGWEVGINEANKYYFKNYIDGSPNYKTLDSYLCDQNLCAITVSDIGGVSLSRLNFAKKEEPAIINSFIESRDPNSGVEYYRFDHQEINLPEHSISNGSNWHVGSGEFLYQGYMDYFLYFDSELNQDQLRKISRSIYSTINFVPEVSGVVSGQITGEEVFVSGVSGEVGIKHTLTGSTTGSGYYTNYVGQPQTGAAPVSGFVYVPVKTIPSIPNLRQEEQTLYKRIQNLSLTFSPTGDVERGPLTNFQYSGDGWQFSGNSGSYYGQTGIGPSGSVFGVTGFDLTETREYWTGRVKNFYETGATSGLLYNKFTYSGVRSEPKYYTKKESYYENGPNESPIYFPNAISTVGSIDGDYFYEIIYDIDNKGINKQKQPSRNTFFNKNVVYIDQKSNPDQLYFFINGVAQINGESQVYKNQYNFPEVNIESGFYVSGTEVFTELDLSYDDDIVYDIVHSGEKNSLAINSLSDYSSAPFQNFNFDNSQVFLNGVKLYSGIDYIDSGGFFPINVSTGATGVYFTYANYSGGISQTGEGGEPITATGLEMQPLGYLSFFNGIRQPKGAIIEHALSSDLISGTRINSKTNIIYTMANGTKQKI